MPPISEFLHCRFIYLKHKFFSYVFGRLTQDRDDDGLNVGFKSAGSHTGTAQAHTLNVLDEPPTPPLTSPFDDHLQLPQTRNCKRKALLVGVESNNELQTKRGLRPLKGPHKDVRDMRQFLIGEFKLSIKKYFERLSTI